jgi:hypothetical protein
LFGVSLRIAATSANAFSGEVVRQEDRVGPRQIGADNLDARLVRGIVRCWQNPEAREERLIERPPEKRIGVSVDRDDIIVQLQRHAQKAGVEGEPLLGGSERLLGGCDLPVHALALLAECAGGYIAALLGLEAEQAHLFAFELVDQLGLGCPNFLDRPMTDGGQRFDGFRPADDVPPLETDWSRLVALNRLLG